MFAADQRGLAVPLRDVEAGRVPAAWDPSPHLCWFSLHAKDEFFADWQKQKAEGDRYDGSH